LHSLFSTPFDFFDFHERLHFFGRFASLGRVHLLENGRKNDRFNLMFFEAASATDVDIVRGDNFFGRRLPGTATPENTHLVRPVTNSRTGFRARGWFLYAVG
jgi:hypothetical protein